MLFGKEGSYKTMLGLRLATCVAEGKEWLGFNTPERGANVLYINAEVPADMIHARVRQINSSVELRGKLYIWNRYDFRIDQDVWFEKLAEVIDRYKINLIVLDPLYKIVSGDMVEPVVVENFQRVVDKLVNTHHVAVFTVSHARKGNKDDPAMANDDMYGRGRWLWWADTVIRVEKEEEENEIRVSFGKHRYSKSSIKPVRFRLEAEELNFVQSIVNLPQPKVQG